MRGDICRTKKVAREGEATFGCKFYGVKSPKGVDKEKSTPSHWSHKYTKTYIGGGALLLLRFAIYVTETQWAWRRRSSPKIEALDLLPRAPVTARVHRSNNAIGRPFFSRENKPCLARQQRRQWLLDNRYCPPPLTDTHTERRERERETCTRSCSSSSSSVSSVWNCFSRPFRTDDDRATTIKGNAAQCI